LFSSLAVKESCCLLKAIRKTCIGLDHCKSRC
jgi:hypothetical protein